MENERNGEPVTATKTKSADSCGCAMGARLMGIAFAVSLTFYGWKFFANKTPLSNVIIKTFLISFLAAGLGKLIGISIYQLKKQRML